MIDVEDRLLYPDAEELTSEWILFHDRCASGLAPSISYPPNYPYGQLHIGDLRFLRATVEDMNARGRASRVRVVSPIAQVVGAYLTPSTAPMPAVFEPEGLSFPADRGLPGPPEALSNLQPTDLIVLHDVVHIQARPLTLLRYLAAQMPPGATTIATLFVSSGASMNLFSQLGFSLLSVAEIRKLAGPSVRVTVLQSDEGSNQWPAFRRAGLILERSPC